MRTAIVQTCDARAICTQTCGLHDWTGIMCTKRYDDDQSAASSAISRAEYDGSKLR